MSNQNLKVKKVIETLSEGSESVQNNPSEENYQKWEGKLDRAGNSPNWIVITIIGVTILVIVFSFSILSGAAVIAVSNSSTTSNLSRPSDAIYFNNHYYKVFIYPSSIDNSYETTKSYANTTCNNLQGYVAVVDVGSSEEEFVWNLLSQSKNENSGTYGFVCEWEN